MDGDKNMKAQFDYYWTHALISDQAYKAIQSECTFVNQNYNASCNKALRSANAEIGHIDHYDIYAPLCTDTTQTTDSVKEYNPFWGDYANTYLNLPEVHKALHANVTGLPYPWSVCSSFVGGRNWAGDAPASLLPTIQDLIKSGIRIWLFSGDQDSVCPVTSTKDCINALGLGVESPWRPWFTNNEVGGYVVGYKGVTFATVRGAGHMVPSFQPERALTMITSFLNNQLPPAAS